MEANMGKKQQPEKANRTTPSVHCKRSERPGDQGSETYGVCGSVPKSVAQRRKIPARLRLSFSSLKTLLQR